MLPALDPAERAPFSSRDTRLELAIHLRPIIKCLSDDDDSVSQVLGGVW